MAYSSGYDLLVASGRLVLHLKALKRMDGLEVEDWERNTNLESRQIDMGAMVGVLCLTSGCL
jgi:hypothetical protein